MPMLTVALLIVPLLISSSAGSAAGTLELCARWRGAQGMDKVALANQLGAAHHLTKNKRLADAQPGDTHSLYRISDLQRLCRGH